MNLRETKTPLLLHLRDFRKYTVEFVEPKPLGPHDVVSIRQNQPGQGLDTRRCERVALDAMERADSESNVVLLDPLAAGTTGSTAGWLCR